MSYEDPRNTPYNPNDPSSYDPRWTQPTPPPNQPQYPNPSQPLYPYGPPPQPQYPNPSQPLYPYGPPPQQPPMGYVTVPLYGQQQTPPPPPQKNWIRRHTVLSGCIGLIAACLIVSTCAGLLGALSNSGSPAADATATSVPPTATLTQHERATAYSAVVQTDSQTMANDLNAIGNDCGNTTDFTTCRADAVTLKSDATKFVSDLNANPAPPCLKPVDQHLRTALADYQKAAQDVIVGIDNTSASDVRAGASLMSQGTSEINRASSAISAATCN